MFKDVPFVVWFLYIIYPVTAAILAVVVSQIIRKKGDKNVD